MCFKKWFTKPDPVVIIIPVPDPIPVPIPDTGGKKIALLFSINDYPGAANDLNGCNNDARDIEQILNYKFPGFNINKFKDAQVTRNRFISEVTKAIAALLPGDFLLISYSGHGTQEYDIHGDESDGYDEAIYLYDGSVIDDDIGKCLKSIPIGATVVLMMDSCFSGTITRVVSKYANRYFQNQFLPIRRHKRKRFAKNEMNWIVLSGCGEQQTSADAFINGEYHGAFTFYALRTLEPGITYTEWMRRINIYLPGKDFDQFPTLEGKESLFSKIVFT